MTVFKKPRIYALFALLTASFASLLQGAQEGAVNRRWHSVSEIGTTVLQSPCTYYALAPAALYAGHQLAKIPLKVVSHYAIENSAALIAASCISHAAYYAPMLALTELMRAQRELIRPEEDRPHQMHYYGPAILQGFIMNNPYPAIFPLFAFGLFSHIKELLQDSVKPLEDLAKHLEAESERLEKNNAHLRKESAKVKEQITSGNQQILELAKERRQLEEELKKRAAKCPICYERFGVLHSTAKCGHTFHTKCLEKWIEMNPQNPHCPYCRAPVIMKVSFE